MGHSHSRSSSAGLDLGHASNTPVLHRKRSTAFSALTLGCASAPYAASLPSYGDYPSREDRSSFSDRDEKRSFDPPPLYAISTTPDIIEDAAADAYKAFLKENPQYQLTWILDALRRSDFSRLDRTGETYVDYMGASIYPASLISVCHGFLQRSLLGNTHSVSNTCVPIRFPASRLLFRA